MKGTGMKAVWDRLRSWKYASWVLYGTLLLLAGFFYGLGEGWFQAAPRDGPAAAAEDTLEARLEDIRSTVRGAGKVRVLVTYATAGERVAATRSEQSGEMKQPATVATEGGQSPIILVEREPEIRGVIVVAEGAADPAVRLSLQRAVQAVTGVPLSCIEVFEMNYPS